MDLHLEGSQPGGIAGDQQRVELLKSRGMLRPGFDGPADDAVTRGTLARALVTALQLRGGVMLRVFGPRARYAVRELQYVGIYPRSSPHQTFSGGQYVAVIGRVEDYSRAQPMHRPEAPLPDEAEEPEPQAQAEVSAVTPPS